MVERPVCGLERPFVAPHLGKVDLGVSGRLLSAAPNSRNETWAAGQQDGEGIFLVFDGAKLDRWQSAHGAFHRERLVQVNRNVHAQASRRETHASDVDPKFVLLHTFAHALINQLTFDCGYSTAAIASSDQP